eukprot:2700980-Rhodomonas_salina.1
MGGADVIFGEFLLQLRVSGTIRGCQVPQYAPGTTIRACQSPLDAHTLTDSPGPHLNQNKGNEPPVQYAVYHRGGPPSIRAYASTVCSGPGLCYSVPRPRSLHVGLRTQRAVSESSQTVRPGARKVA